MPVVFTQEDHRYTSHDGEFYTSVTGLLKKFTPPFDSKYWSTYKAMQAVLTRYGIWDSYKRKAGGWENVVNYARYIDKDFKYKNEIVQERINILLQWEENKEDALAKGTAYHKMKESSVKEKAIYTPDLKEVPVLADVDVVYQGIESCQDGLYPELILYNDDWKLAGQADWVMIEGKTVNIKDYKTSKAIKKEGFRDEKLITPLHHLPNANFYIYALQLSLYALMMEVRGFKIGVLSIEHVDKVTQKTIELYPVNYYRAEAMKLVQELEKMNKKKN